MHKTQYLQMYSFSVILTSLQSLNLSFPLLFCYFYCYTSISTMYRHPNFPHLLHFHPDSLYSHLILCLCIPMPFFAFPPIFAAFTSFRFPIFHFDFYRQPAHFDSLNRSYVWKIVALVQKRVIPFFTTVTSSVLYQKLFTLYCLK